MSRENVFEISPYLIGSWEDEIQTATPEYLEEIVDLCAYQRRGWMVSARGTKAAGVRPWVAVNMAWKYHRRFLMLRRATRKERVPVQASLF